MKLVSGRFTSCTIKMSTQRRTDHHVILAVERGEGEKDNNNFNLSPYVAPLLLDWWPLLFSFNISDDGEMQCALWTLSSVFCIRPVVDVGSFVAVTLGELNYCCTFPYSNCIVLIRIRDNNRWMSALFFTIYLSPAALCTHILYLDPNRDRDNKGHRIAAHDNLNPGWDSRR